MKVLELSSFVFGEDVLYFLGDVSDRGEDSARCLEYLYTFPRFKAVLGNHDIYLYKFLTSGLPDRHWVKNLGGANTIISLNHSPLSAKQKYEIGQWIGTWPVCRVLDDAILVHGDIPSSYSLDDLLAFEKDTSMVEMKEDDGRFPLVWGRNCITSAFAGGHALPLDFSKDIYLGHTPVGPLPLYSEKYHLHALDTGSCYEGGKLTLMDMDSHEFWQA